MKTHALFVTPVLLALLALVPLAMLTGCAADDGQGEAAPPEGWPAETTCPRPPECTEFWCGAEMGNCTRCVAFCHVLDPVGQEYPGGIECLYPEADEEIPISILNCHEGVGVWESTSPPPRTHANR